jgi:hypothetical protein
MTIPEFSSGPLRRRIAFIHNLPRKAKTIFEQRGYQCDLLDDSKLDDPGQIATTDSVVLTQTLKKPEEIRKELRQVAHVLDHGCRIYVRYAREPSAKSIVINALNAYKLPPSGFS